MDYVQISEEEGDEPVELPTEDDGTLLLSTLQAQFPGACGLKWRNEETKTVRGVRLADGHFYPPAEKDSWGSTNFFCVFPKENKRKSDDTLENSTPKTKRVESRIRCTDLIVLGLSFKTTEDALREYFEKFGEVIMSQVKKDFNTGQSKGFGFVRFAKYESQVRVLAARHMIDERWCEVKVPNSKEGVVQQLPSKIFVGRCTEDITVEDLREYFSKFGEVTDVFIPRPFRAFSFVTFLDPDVAQSLCGEDHLIKGVSVYVSNAAPKTDRNRNNQMNNGGNNYTPFRSNNRGGGGGNSYGGGNFNNGGGYGQNPNGYGMNGSSQDGGGNYGMNGGGGNNMPWNYNNSNRANLDMPNLQSLGINPQGPNSNSNQGSNMNNPLGGLDLNSMNPALVAAALNQFGLLGGNFGNQDQDYGKGSNNTSSGTSNPGASFLSWLAQNSSNVGGKSQSRNPGQGSLNDSHHGNSGSGGGNQSWPRNSNSVAPVHGPYNGNNAI